MADPIKAAKGIFDQFLAKADPASMPEVQSSDGAPIAVYMAQIGSKGGKIGGKRRLKTMTPAQRKAVARKAAKVRWRSSTLKSKIG